MNDSFAHLRSLPSLETYGNEGRAREIISAAPRNNPDLVGIYIIASKARVPLSILDELGVDHHIVKIAHERNPSPNRLYGTELLMVRLLRLRVT
jgi:LacI family transcriptional regulator